MPGLLDRTMFQDPIDRQYSEQGRQFHEGIGEISKLPTVEDNPLFDVLPGIGEFVDATDSYGAYENGNYAMASLYGIAGLAGLIPIAGDAMRYAIKEGIKRLPAKEVNQIARAIQKGDYDFLTSYMKSGKGASVGRAMSQKLNDIDPKSAPHLGGQPTFGDLPEGRVKEWLTDDEIVDDLTEGLVGQDYQVPPGLSLDKFYGYSPHRDEKFIRDLVKDEKSLAKHQKKKVDEFMNDIRSFGDPAKKELPLQTERPGPLFEDAGVTADVSKINKPIEDQARRAQEFLLSDGNDPF